ncbi:hypothetical protein CEW92_14725 [Bacillaceae bacterium SAS-127]|nr:hypothetical protein CEW92_14725 [Bacillaceae bacterium SAS-127]
MYVGRDLTELSTMSIKNWNKSELAYFHQSFQQIVPYLNAEGQTIHQDIVEEIMNRDSVKSQEVDYAHDTEIPFDLGGS